LEQLILGYWQGFVILFNAPIYAWWLSVAAIPLNISWSLHNVIAWMKIKPFLSRRVSLIFIGTVILVQPYWVVEIYANFTYFHSINNVFLHTRPWEALCRYVSHSPSPRYSTSRANCCSDPWWIFTTIFLFYNIKTKYELTIPQITRISPRFAVMLGAMVLSICFIVLDVLSVTNVLKESLPVGINPFWKLSFVFKCLTDAVVLDDFKTALDRLRAFKISRLGTFPANNTDSRSHKPGEGVGRTNSEISPGQSNAVTDIQPEMPCPDGDYVQPHWEEIKPNGRHMAPDHIEHDLEAYRLRTRNASCDRDSEEYATGNDPERQRESSDAHILTHTKSWRDSEDDQMETDLNADLEYAEAVRQITLGTAYDGRGVGIAR
jgi:hypothetical protein